MKALDESTISPDKHPQCICTYVCTCIQADFSRKFRQIPATQVNPLESQNPHEFDYIIANSAEIDSGSLSSDESAADQLDDISSDDELYDKTAEKGKQDERQGNGNSSTQNQPNTTSHHSTHVDNPTRTFINHSYSHRSAPGDDSDDEDWEDQRRNGRRASSNSGAPPTHLPRSSYVDSDSNYSDDENVEYDSFGNKRKVPPVGKMYQADLTICDEEPPLEDDAGGILLWDPTRLDDNEVDSILDCCKVSNKRSISPPALTNLLASSSTSSLASSVHSVDSDSSTSPGSPRTSDNISLTTPNNTQQSDHGYKFEHFRDVTAIVSKQIEKGEPISIPHERDDVLCLEDMLQVIHQSNYNMNEVFAILEAEKLRGWHPFRPSYQRWKRHEMELFEHAMDQPGYYKVFEKIQSIVQTRSVAECVEYYFAWKHTPRHITWLSQKNKPHLSTNQVFSSPNLSSEIGSPQLESRQLPGSVRVPSKKRKREPENVLLEQGDLAYLEVFGDLANPQDMLNIFLNAPSTLVDDVVDIPSGANLIDTPQSLINIPRLVSTMSPKRPKHAEFAPEDFLDNIPRFDNNNASISPGPITTINPVQMLSNSSTNVDHTTEPELFHHFE